jgi:predicted ATP-grasp superfamily ATP-dependent carboligase
MCVCITVCIVFQCESRKLLLVQQRSPVVRGRHAEHATGINTWARAIGVKQIVLLTSTHASTRVDKELSGYDMHHSLPMSTNDWFLVV